MSKKHKKKNSNKKRSNKPNTNKPKVDNTVKESAGGVKKEDIKKNSNNSESTKTKAPVKETKPKDVKEPVNEVKTEVTNEPVNEVKIDDIKEVKAEETKEPIKEVDIEDTKEIDNESGFKRYINSLKDDAKIEQENMKNMNSFKERFSYFMFYHKWHVLIAFIVLVAFVYFVVSVVISKRPVYYCVVVNDSYNQEFKSELQKELDDVIEFNPSKEKVEISTYSTVTEHYEPGYYGGDAGTQGIFSLMMDNLIDTMIAEPDEMEWFSMDNNFCNLKEVLPSDLYETIEPNIVMLKDTTGEAKPYAVDISNTDLYKDGKSNLKKPCIGIYSTTRNLNESIEVIKYIFNYVEQ